MSVLSVLYIVTCLFYVTIQFQKQLASSNQDDDFKFIKCVTGILNTYFSEGKELTYVDMNPDNDALLKAIHSSVNISIVLRQSTQQVFIPNRGYLIYSTDVTNFIEYFQYLVREPMWNPYAKFLIVIVSIQENELMLIFDELLKYHVINVLVVNETDDVSLYTYNPFDNYACGNYYDSFISYGLCSQSTNNLYPNKLVTGLKKCEFRALVIDRPPFTINMLTKGDKDTLWGLEEIIMDQLAKLEEFTVNVTYFDSKEVFSTVSPNMTAFGPMELLQRNNCDIMFGGMKIVAQRAEAFTFLCGYHDYSDELRFAVKSSSLAPSWRYIYLEFELDVWALLLVVLLIFSFLMTILLRTKDWGVVVLRLIDNLLLHGYHVRTRLTVNCILITWVWFAYLINAFYQSNLFSFTTHPNVDYQVSDEKYIIEYDFEACFSPSLRQFLSNDAFSLSKSRYFREEGCQTTAEAMFTVSTTEHIFTLVPSYYYLYNEYKYRDKWGRSLIYYFHKPYTKFLFGFYFYKGFPITKKLQMHAFHMRESGLISKNLKDHYYSQKIKQKFSVKPYETRFLFPWCISVAGFIMGTIVFVIELLTKHIKIF